MHHARGKSVDLDRVRFELHQHSAWWTVHLHPDPPTSAHLSIQFPHFRLCLSDIGVLSYETNRRCPPRYGQGIRVTSRKCPHAPNAAMLAHFKHQFHLPKFNTVQPHRNYFAHSRVTQHSRLLRSARLSNVQYMKVLRLYTLLRE